MADFKGRDRVTELGGAVPDRRRIATLHTKTIGGGGYTSSLVAVSGRLDSKARITRPYEESGWVHACLKPIGQAVASVPLEFWTGNPDEDKKAAKLPDSHPLVQLFRKPNPMMTGAQFFEAGALHRKLDGEDFWFLLDGKGDPVKPGSDLRVEFPASILSVRGTSVGVQVDGAKGWPIKWRASVAGGAFIEADPLAVIQFRDYNPDDPIRGIGDIEAAISDVDLEWQATRYQRSVIKNSGDPGGIVTMEGGTLAPDEHEALENEVGEQFSVQNAGRWRVMAGRGIKYEPNKLSPRDMDFAKLLAWIRDKIAAIVGIPLPIIGVLDHATLANFAQSVELFWKGGNGILAYLSSIEDVVNSRFLPRLKMPNGERAYARFNIGKIKALQEDKNLQYEIAVKISQANIGVSFEEALRLVGIDVEKGVLPTGSVKLVPAGLVLLDAIINGVHDGADDAVEGVVPGGQPVQDTALNGAQISSLLEILAAISAGTLTPDGGAAAILVSFPTITSDEAKRLVDGVIIAPKPDQDAEPEGGDDGNGGDEPPKTDAPAEDVPDDKDKAAPVETRDATEADAAKAAEADRRAFWAVKESSILKHGEGHVARKYKGWRKKYEAAQFKRLRDYVDDPNGVRFAGVVVRAENTDDPTDPIRRWTEADIEHLLLHRDEWGGKLRDVVSKPLLEVFANALEDAAEEIGSEFPLLPADPAVVAFLRNQEIKLAEGHLSTLADQVREALLKALEKTTNQAELSAAVEEVLPEIEGNLKGSFSDRTTRANLIAQNEVANAANAARHMEMVNAGVKKHEWVTSNDSAVRGTPGGPNEDAQYSHFELDGKVVDLGSPFDAEKHPGLTRPKDPNGKPGDVIRCRCFSRAVYEEKDEDQ